ncbi:hypothetical protein TNCV_1857511 [Trichonephila clavipes]|nr:hypothetical protein TNCV_1857511 [Trichonephila clavipes]
MYCHLHGAQGCSKRQAYNLALCHDEFRGLANVSQIREGSAIRRLYGGCSSPVVKVSDEFESSTTKDPPCRAAMHVKSVES